MRKTHIPTGLFPTLLGLAVAAAAPAASRGEEPAKPIAVGDKAPNSHSLRDPRGNLRSLSGFKDAKVVVGAFLSVDCPVANLYLPRILELEKQYRGRQVQFLGVYANESEDLEQIAGHASDHDLPFPVLKDCGQKLADRTGVGRVSTVLVLDGEGVLRYRGRIDDRYGASARRPKATRDDLATALDELLAGKKISVAETEADGCLLDRGTKPAVKNAVTYAKHVAPILQKTARAATDPSKALRSL